MQLDSRDRLDDPIHQTKISVRQVEISESDLVQMVVNECQEWFDGKWDDKYGHWVLETDTTGGTAPDQYTHVFVYVEATPGTSEQLLGNWANRFIRSEVQPQIPNNGGEN